MRYTPEGRNFGGDQARIHAGHAVLQRLGHAVDACEGQLAEYWWWHSFEDDTPTTCVPNAYHEWSRIGRGCLVFLRHHRLRAPAGDP